MRRGKVLVPPCACSEFWSQDSKSRIFSPCNFYICGWNFVVLPLLKNFHIHIIQDNIVFGVLYQLVHGMHQSIPVVPILPSPPPPGYCRAFACLVSAGAGALANFVLPGGQAFANPRTTHELLKCPWFPIKT